MVSRDDAERIALDYLVQLSREPRPGDEAKLELVIAGGPEETPRGFRFYFQSKAYIETGSISYALAGNLPFLVNCETGAIEHPEQE